MRQSVRVSGITGLAITKLDVLTGIDKLRICVGYRTESGEEFATSVPADLNVFARCRPVYMELDGWTEDITSAKRIEDLPRNTKRYVDTRENLAGVKVVLVSVGADRNEDIVTRIFQGGNHDRARGPENAGSRPVPSHPASIRAPGRPGAVSQPGRQRTFNPLVAGRIPHGPQKVKRASPCSRRPFRISCGPDSRLLDHRGAGLCDLAVLHGRAAGGADSPDDPAALDDGHTALDGADAVQGQVMDV